ncbi:unnamed protein product [Cercopithifilaria johnstoni]|uniref:Uncharacterized protein n=1 Tax=Cercopithifilaria johnstoni TaxID=2874296 RepID=A0A8J2LTV8_9BILA|nr:unnamed protein product [Cercopithifilaria johnstoni]
MENIAIIAITICIISAACAQLPVPYLERPHVINTNTRCIGILFFLLSFEILHKVQGIGLEIYYEHAQGLQHFERILMAKIRLPNVHPGTMLEIDVKDAVKFTPSTTAGKKLMRLASPIKMVAVFVA